jgi:hypothetical protein
MIFRRLRNRFRPQWPQGCWPDEAQRWLLQACVGEDDAAAQEAFRHWSRRVPFFFIDAGSHKLLLLLYERLREWDVAYPDMERLKGVARYAWVRHQKLTLALHHTLQGLNAANIPAMLLKGAALNATVYAGGTRLMSDLDIAVPRERAEDAMALVERLGWQCQFRHRDRLASVIHGCHYARGDAQLDLHWDFFHGKPLNDEAQAVLWQASTTIDVGSAQAQVLCPADQLLHTCEHGMRMNEHAPFRWLADACLIVRACPAFDWRRLAEMAQWLQLVQPVKQTLHFLCEQLGVDVPRAAFKSLARKRATLMSHVEFFINTHRMPGSHYVLRDLPSQVFWFVRAKRANPQLTPGEFLTVINGFEPPLMRNIDLLLEVQAAANAQLCSEWIGRFTSLASKRPSERSLHVNPWDSHAWEGFFPPEPTIGGIFRWSHASASVNLPIGEHHQTVVVRMANIRPWHGDLDQSLRLRLNRSAIAPQSVRYDNGELSFDIEPAMLADYPLQRLELRCPKWDAAHGDPRELGVPVREVLLCPKAA